MNFAKDYETDDSERAELRGVQDQEMLHVARKLSMCCSTDKHTKLPIPASVKVDVSDVDQNVASMGRLLRARLDLHLLNAKKWSERDDQWGQLLVRSSTLVQVLPPSWRIWQWQNYSWCEGRSHRNTEWTWRVWSETWV